MKKKPCRVPLWCFSPRKRLIKRFEQSSKSIEWHGRKENKRRASSARPPLSLNVTITQCRHVRLDGQNNWTSSRLSHNLSSQKGEIHGKKSTSLKQGAFCFEIETSKRTSCGLFFFPKAYGTSPGTFVLGSLKGNQNFFGIPFRNSSHP